MKKLTPLFFFFVVTMLPQLSIGQNYHPMLGKSMNNWSVLYSFTFIDGSQNPEHYSYLALHYTQGDSVISNVHYKKLYILDTNSVSSGGHNGFVGLIREDSIHRRLYYIDKDSSKELLIYDFGLKLGDSIHLFFEDRSNGVQTSFHPPKTDWYKVVDTSYVSTPMGMRKRITLYNRQYDAADISKSLYWVEGIGSLKSPPYFYYPVNGGGNGDGLSLFSINLQCELKDSIFVYGDGGKDCFNPPPDTSHHAGIANASSQSIEISKIIANANILSMDISGYPAGTAFHVLLYDMLGKTLVNNDLKAYMGGEAEYDIKLPVTLKPGMYLVNISSQNQSTVKKIFIN